MLSLSSEFDVLNRMFCGILTHNYSKYVLKVKKCIAYKNCLFNVLCLNSIKETITKLHKRQLLTETQCYNSETPNQDHCGCFQLSGFCLDIAICYTEFPFGYFLEFIISAILLLLIILTK